MGIKTQQGVTITKLNDGTGAAWYSGVGEPELTLGQIGDFYLDTATENVYKKTASRWELTTNIKGSPGTPGISVVEVKRWCFWHDNTNPPEYSIDQSTGIPSTTISTIDQLTGVSSTTDIPWVAFEPTDEWIGKASNDKPIWGIDVTKYSGGTQIYSGSNVVSLGSYITLNGVVTFKDDLGRDSGKTLIHGSNIISGTVTAQQINASELTTIGDPAGEHITISGSSFAAYKDENDPYIVIDEHGINYTNNPVGQQLQTMQDATFNAQSTANGSVGSVAVYYALGDDEANPPETGWSTTAPPHEVGKYMWQKTVVTKNNGSVVTTTTCIQGADGQDIEWKGESSSPPANPRNGWCYRNSNDGNVYIWNNNNWDTMIEGADRNFFWVDNAGAHISLKDQVFFDEDGKPVKNVLINSDGFNVRTGHNVVSSFGKDEIQLGTKSNYSRIKLNGSSAAEILSYREITNTGLAEEYWEFKDQIDNENPISLELLFTAGTGDEVTFYDYINVLQNGNVEYSSNDSNVETLLVYTNGSWVNDDYKAITIYEIYEAVLDENVKSYLLFNANPVPDPNGVVWWAESEGLKIHGPAASYDLETDPVRYEDISIKKESIWDIEPGPHGTMFQDKASSGLSVSAERYTDSEDYKYIVSSADIRVDNKAFEEDEGIIKTMNASLRLESNYTDNPDHYIADEPESQALLIAENIALYGNRIDIAGSLYNDGYKVLAGYTLKTYKASISLKGGESDTVSVTLQTVSGKTPVGVVGFTTNQSTVVFGYCRVSGNTVGARVRREGTSTTAVTTSVTMHVLYL